MYLYYIIHSYFSTSSEELYQPPMTILLNNFTFWWILLNSVVFLGVCSIARFGFFCFVGVFSSPYLV